MARSKAASASSYPVLRAQHLRQVCVRPRGARRQRDRAQQAALGVGEAPTLSVEHSHEIERIDLVGMRGENCLAQALRTAEIAFPVQRARLRERRGNVGRRAGGRGAGRIGGRGFGTHSQAGSTHGGAAH